MGVVIQSMGTGPLWRTISVEMQADAVGMVARLAGLARGLVQTPRHAILFILPISTCASSRRFLKLADCRRPTLLHFQECLCENSLIRISKVHAQDLLCLCLTCM